MLEYTLHHTDDLARHGTLKLNHGAFQTPMFMPVGTYGAVKGMSPDDLEAVARASSWATPSTCGCAPAPPSWKNWAVCMVSMAGIGRS